MRGTSFIGTALSLMGIAVAAASAPACGPRQTGERLPQKTGIRSAHNRVYISAVGELDMDAGAGDAKGAGSRRRLDLGLKDCRWDRMSYLGHRETTAYTQAEAPSTLPAEVAPLFLEIKALDADGVTLYSTRIRNPYYTPSPHPGFLVTDCTLQFFVDLPESVPLASVERLTLAAVSDPSRVFVIRGPFHQTPSGAGDSGATAHKLPSGPLTPGSMLFTRPGQHGLVSGRDFLAIPLLQSGAPEERFDLVILGDGFDAGQVPVESPEALRASLFGRKALDTAEYLLSQEPYRSMRDRINVWIVGTPSRESGADDPRAGVVRDTFYDATFDVSCIDRLVGVKNGLRALEMASETPFDQMLVIVNSQKYGGAGGIVPTFTLTADALPVMAHELGHSLGLLSDMYYYFRSVDDSQAGGGNSDSAAAAGCQTPQNDSRISPVATQTGGNALYGTDPQLAPNLTRGGQTWSAKWKNLITVSSPVVEMQFPIGIPRREGQMLTFTYRPRRAQPHLILVGGPSSANAAAIDKAVAFGINEAWIAEEDLVSGWAADSSGVSGSSIVFYEIPSVRVRPGEEIQVHLWYATEDDARAVERFSANAHTLPIASQIFDPARAGLFRGAFPSLTEVWRSSYASKMMVTTLPHDVVEQDALRRAMLRYSGEAP